MAFVMRCIARAFGPTPLHEKGAYLRAYDPHKGKHGDIRWTHDPVQAKRFADQREAAATYLQVNGQFPTRPDGAPNRPLTAWTIEVIREEDMKP